MILKITFDRMTRSYTRDNGETLVASYELRKRTGWIFRCWEYAGSGDREEILRRIEPFLVQPEIFDTKTMTLADADAAMQEMEIKRTNI